MKSLLILIFSEEVYYQLQICFIFVHTVTKNGKVSATNDVFNK